MKKLLCFSGVLLIATWLVQGFSIWSITAAISTVIFCSRKVGYFCKENTLFAIEGVGVVLALGFKIIFKHFVWRTFLITIVIRIIFLIMCHYYIKTYIFVKEVHRKVEE